MIWRNLVLVTNFFLCQFHHIVSVSLGSFWPAPSPDHRVSSQPWRAARHWHPRRPGCLTGNSAAGTESLPSRVQVKLAFVRWPRRRRPRPRSRRGRGGPAHGPGRRSKAPVLRGPLIVKLVPHPQRLWRWTRRLGSESPNGHWHGAAAAWSPDSVRAAATDHVTVGSVH